MLDLIESYNAQQREERRLRDEHDAKITAAEEKIRKAEARVARLEKQRDKIKSTSWLKAVAEPLAAALAERTGLGWEIYGPFGLAAETSIYLREDMSKSITEQPTLSISLEPHFVGDDNDLVVMYRTGEYEDGYERGSLGALNGLNAIKKPLPDNIGAIEALLTKSKGVTV